MILIVGLLVLYLHFWPLKHPKSIEMPFMPTDSTPSSQTAQFVMIHPLVFNISMLHHERITLAELHLFTLVWKAQRPYAGVDCKVTIYKIHEGVLWTKEVEKEGRRRDKEEVVAKDIHAKNNSWVSFDLTHVVALWLKSGYAAHRLEVHIAIVGLEEERAAQEVNDEGGTLVELSIDRSLEGKHNAEIIVFSDDQSRDHRLDKRELNQMIEHENDLQSQQAFWGHGDQNTGHTDQDELDSALLQLQPNVIYDTPSRVRRNVKSEPCKRMPLFVDFKDIGWDTWIIQPLGYEAYECNGVCSPPMTSEVSPTKHAIVQSLLNIKSPKKVSRACCVPTKLEPISLLYHENGVVTFKHKYEGMVVAECGCR